MEASNRPQAWAWATSLFCAAFFALFAFWCFHGTELWYDEVATLNEYVDHFFLTLVGNYSQPNNHIFFSVLMRAFIEGFSLPYDYTYVDWYRLLPFALSLGTLGYALMMQRRLLPGWYGALHVSILCTTCAFLVYSMQLRGYILSIFLFYALLYHWWSQLRAEGWLHGLAVALFAALCLYTLPTNAVLLFGLGLTGLTRLAVTYTRRGSLGAGQLRALAALTLGVLAGVLLYMPVWGQLAERFFVGSVPGADYLPTGWRLWSFVAFVSRVLWDLASYRVLLLLPAAYALCRLLRGTHRLGQAEGVVLADCAAVLGVFFVVLFVSGYVPPARLCSTLVPVFALGLTALIHFGLRASPLALGASLARPVMVLAVTSLVTLVAVFGLHQQGVLAGQTQLQHHHVFHLDSFRYLESVRAAAEDPRQFFLVHKGDPYNIYTLLAVTEAKYVDDFGKLPIVLAETGSAYVFTTDKESLQQYLRTSLPSYGLVPLAEAEGYHNLFIVKRR